MARPYDRQWYCAAHSGGRTTESISVGNWRHQARCRGIHTDTFFPETSDGRNMRRHRENLAKEICARCSVITQCRIHAIAESEQYGVWGGLTPSERRATIMEKVPRMKLGKLATDMPTELP